MREHGTYAKYKLENCGCYPCAAEGSAYNMNRERAIAYGTWHPFVDAGPVRAHALRLRECGIGSRRLAALAGVHRSLLVNLINGKPGKEPSRRIRPDAAARILAVEPTLDNIAPKTPVGSAGTHRRVQALVAVGWSQAKIADRLGMTPANFSSVMRAGQVTSKTACAVRDLCEEWWNQRPPEATHRDKIAASRARNHARKHGWLPLAAWDEDLIDLPASELEAELGRRVAVMDDDELRRCHTARYKHGELSPLVVAAAHEWTRQRELRRAEVATRQEVAA